MTEPEKILTDQEVADRLRQCWAQIKEDAITLGWRGYRTNVDLLGKSFDISHHQAVGQKVSISRVHTKVTEL